jgi:hypothetical protein
MSGGRGGGREYGPVMGKTRPFVPSTSSTIPAFSGREQVVNIHGYFLAFTSTS